jgi:hypothetical protein
MEATVERIFSATCAAPSAARMVAARSWLALLLRCRTTAELSGTDRCKWRWIKLVGFFLGGVHLQRGVTPSCC